MSRELDTAVAQAMELRLAQGQEPRYSEDIAAAYTMEDWVEANGDPGQYTQALHGIVLDDWGFYAGKETTGGDYLKYLDGLFWRIAHASPEQRCRAFLEVAA